MSQRIEQLWHTLGCGKQRVAYNMDCYIHSTTISRQYWSLEALKMSMDSGSALSMKQWTLVS
jgi:hypothetical protein